MSRCRATSFYLAPNEHRSFEEWSVHTRHNGAWVAITHRRDIERLSDDPRWDQVCYVAFKGPSARAAKDRDIAALINQRPEDVEVWRLNARIVNGRRDGIEHHLHAVAKNGSKRAGGTREAVGAVLGISPASKATVKWFEQAGLQPTVEAAALRLLSAAINVLDDSQMQSLVSRLSAISCAVPMPEFDASTLDFTFLSRYNPQRRVTLIADLWHTHAMKATGNTLRVAQELANRGGPALVQAHAVIETIAQSSPQLVADALAAELIWFDELTTMVTPQVLAELVKRPRHRHIVAFHNLNSDPAAALEVLRDKRALENKDLAIPHGPMHPAVAKAVLDELATTPIMRHTHSSMQCRNILRLAISLAATTPDGAPMLARAYANWTRTKSSLNSWAPHDVSEMFANVTLMLDRASIERLHKTHVEHARFFAAYLGRRRSHSASANGDNAALLGDGTLDAQGEYARQNASKYFSEGLLALIESQPEAPKSVKLTAQAALAASEWTYRTPTGRLAAWHTRFREHSFEPAELVAAFRAEAAEHNGYERVVPLANKYAVLISQCVHDEDRFQESLTAITDAVAELGAASPDKRMFQIAAGKIAVQARSVRQVVRGEFSVTELLGDASFSNPLWIALESHAQQLPPHARAALFQYSKDPDVALQGFILHGQCDVFGVAKRAPLSADVHVLTLLDGVATVEWPERPKHWSDLPTSDFLPWQLAPVADVFSNKSVIIGDEPYNINVIRDIQQLNANSAPNNMGNCTSTYASGIRQGRDVILAIGRGARTEINVSLAQSHISGEGWVITEVKGPQNVAIVPEQERQLRTQLELMLAPSEHTAHQTAAPTSIIDADVNADVQQ